jgi:hypothetical protein
VDRTATVTTFTQILQDPRFRDGLAVFGSSYTKRMLEGQYDKLISSAVGQRLYNLGRPTKLGIEAALNLLAAYISTNETALTDTAWKKFAYQVVMDAPSEIAKRLLNGPGAQSTRASEASDASISGEQQLAWETLRQLEPQTLEDLLTWLRGASDADRRQLADYLSRLVENQGPKSSVDSENASNAGALPTPSSVPREPRARRASLVSDLGKGMARLNEKLERRAAKRAEKLEGD